MLPCLSLILENRNNFSNNLSLELISIGEHKISEMITEIKSVYLALGIATRSVDFIVLEDENEVGFEILVNLIPVGTVTTFELPNGTTVTRATLIKEPIFSQCLNITT